MEKSKFDLQKIEKKLKKYLDEDRLWHTLGVMHTAASLVVWATASRSSRIPVGCDAVWR